MVDFDLVGIDRENTAAQILFEGAQELLGEEFMRNVMEEHISAGSCGWTLAQVGPLLQNLEARYGSAGSRGMMLRIGRLAFAYGLKQLGDQVGFRAVDYRLLPAPRRLENGLHTLADVVADACGCQVEVSDTDTAWQWKMHWQGMESGSPCYLITGLLQGFSSWAGNGRYYQVTETECQAAGASNCIFQIDKKPLD